MLTLLLLRRLRPAQRYVWRPALEVRDGRTAAALMTFSGN